MELSNSVGPINKSSVLPVLQIVKKSDSSQVNFEIMTSDDDTKIILKPGPLAIDTQYQVVIPASTVVCQYGGTIDAPLIAE